MQKFSLPLVMDGHRHQNERNRSRSKVPRPNIGIGVAMGHHGEVLQGGVDHGEGVKRFLVTLPWPSIKSRAKFFPLQNSDIVTEPEWKLKSRKAAMLTMLFLGIENHGGFLEVTSDATLELGLGSSTSDVVATIRAVAAAFNEELHSHEISEIAVMAEFASDSIMYEEQAVVFCQREGVVLEALENRLPPAFVIGFNTSPNGAGISTVEFPLPAYDWQELGSFRPLLGAIRAAVRMQSVHLLGKVATASSKINQRFLPKPNFDALLDLLGDSGACGLQVAHSGSVAGYMFDSNDSDLAKKISITKRGLSNIGINDVWYFNTVWETQ